MVGGGAMGRCRRLIVLGLVSHYKWHPSTRIATLPRIFPGAVLKLDFNGAHPVLILDLPRLRAAVPGALISPFICHSDTRTSGSFWRLLSLLQMAGNSIFRRCFDREQAEEFLAFVGMSHILVGVTKGEQLRPAVFFSPSSPLIIFKFGCTAVHTSRLYPHYYSFFSISGKTTFWWKSLNNN